MLVRDQLLVYLMFLFICENSLLLSPYVKKYTTNCENLGLQEIQRPKRGSDNQMHILNYKVILLCLRGVVLLML